MEEPGVRLFGSTKTSGKWIIRGLGLRLDLPVLFCVLGVCLCVSSLCWVSCP
jgi:hypothetical protein